MDIKAIRRFLYALDIMPFLGIIIVMPLLVYVFGFYLIDFIKYIVSSPFSEYSYKMLFVLLSPIIFIYIAIWSIRTSRQRIEFYKELEKNFGFEPPNFFSFTGYHGVYKDNSVRYFHSGWGEKGKRKGTKIAMKPVSAEGKKGPFLQFPTINLFLNPFYDDSDVSMKFKFRAEKDLNPSVTQEAVMNYFNFLGPVLYSFAFFQNNKNRILELRKEVTDINELWQILDSLVNFDLPCLK